MSTDNIQVAIRVRPFLEREDQEKNLWQIQENQICQLDDDGHMVNEIYSFDHIFGTSKTNHDIYNDIVKGFVETCLNGLNSTIFAYGQTSSGKTYTMLGDDNNRGVMSHTIDDVFTYIANVPNRKFLLRVSYIEIYNEKINDLLDPNNKDLKIRETNSGFLALPDAKEELVATRAEVLELLRIGTLNRQVGETFMNERSSRSHTIFRLMIESVQDDNSCVQVSTLNLVDLAGSERVAQTKATHLRFREGVTINKSLSTLGLVIRQLSDNKDFINFRDSKLTRLLQQSLGGNAKTLIIATITLASVEDTHSTLSFAQRAKAIKNKPKVIEIISNADKSKRYERLNKNLQDKLREQLEQNEKLEKIKDESSKEILRLQEQLQTINIFQHGTPIKIEVGTKRRHTIGCAEMKPFLQPITEEEPEAPVQNSANVPSPSTPKSVLRTRFIGLKQEYEELVDYTRIEDNVLAEYSKINEDLKKKLQESQLFINKLQQQRLVEEETLTTHLKDTFKRREQELVEQIQSLKQQVESNTTKESNCDDFMYDFCQELMDGLLQLQQYITDNSPPDSTCMPDSPTTSIMESFNSKLNDSEDIIKKQIAKQMNSFCSDKLNESFTLPNEFDCFNNLLKEFSELHGQKHNVDNYEFLVKIYESFLIKNELIGRCLQELKSKNDSNEIEKTQNEEKAKRIKKLEKTSKEYQAFFELHRDCTKNEIISNYQREISSLEAKNQESHKLSEKYRIQLDELQHSIQCFNALDNERLEMRNNKLTAAFDQQTTQIETLTKEMNECKAKNVELQKCKEELEKIISDELKGDEFVPKILKLQNVVQHYKDIADSAEEEQNELARKISHLHKQLWDYREAFGDIEYATRRPARGTYNYPEFSGRMIPVSTPVKNMSSPTTQQKVLKNTSPNKSQSGSPNSTQNKSCSSNYSSKKSSYVSQQESCSGDKQCYNDSCKKRMDQLNKEIYNLKEEVRSERSAVEQMENQDREYIKQLDENAQLISMLSDQDQELTSESSLIKKTISEMTTEIAHLKGGLRINQIDLEESHDKINELNCKLKAELLRNSSAVEHDAERSNRLKIASLEDIIRKQKSADKKCCDMILKLEVQLNVAKTQKAELQQKFDALTKLSDETRSELQASYDQIAALQKTLSYCQQHQVEDNVKIKCLSEELEKEQENAQYYIFQTKSLQESLLTSENTAGMKIKSLEEELHLEKQTSKKYIDELKSFKEKPSLTQEIYTRDIKLKSLEVTVKDLETTQLKMQEHIVLLADQLDLERQHKEDHIKKTKYLSGELNSQKSEIMDRDAKIVNLQHELEKLKAVFETKSGEMMSLRDEIATKQLQLQSTSAQVACLQEELKMNEHHPKEVESQLLEKLHITGEEVKNLQEQLQKQKDQSQNKTLKIVSLNEDIETNKKLIDEYSTKISSLEDELQQLKQNNKDQSKKLHDTLNTIESLQNQIQKSESQFREQNATIDYLNKEVENKTEQERIHRVSLESITNELRSEKQQNIELTDKINKLQIDSADKNSDEFDKIVTEKDDIINNFRTKQKLSSIYLSKLLTQVVKHVKQLHTATVSQEERLYLHNVRKELKDLYQTIKNHLKGIENGFYDLSKVYETISSSFEVVSQYTTSEKAYLRSLLDKLQVSNSASLQELKKVRDSCISCDKIKMENVNLQRQLHSKEQMLDDTLEKLRDVQRRSLSEVKRSCVKCNELLHTNSELRRKCVGLEVKLLEQEEPEESQAASSSATVQYYQERDKRQRELIEKYENDNALKGKINQTDAEVQCEIMSNNVMIDLKKVCTMRKAKIEELQCELQRQRSLR